MENTYNYAKSLYNKGDLKGKRVTVNGITFTMPFANPFSQQEEKPKSIIMLDNQPQTITANTGKQPIQPDEKSTAGTNNSAKSTGSTVTYTPSVSAGITEQKPNTTLAITTQPQASEQETGGMPLTITNGSKIRKRMNNIISVTSLNPFDKNIFDGIDDETIERNIPLAENTIKSNIEKGLLGKDYNKKYPYLLDGLSTFYAADENNNKKAANEARKIAYMENLGKSADSSEAIDNNIGNKPINFYENELNTLGDKKENSIIDYSNQNVLKAQSTNSPVTNKKKKNKIFTIFNKEEYKAIKNLEKIAYDQYDWMKWTVGPVRDVIDIRISSSIYKVYFNKDIINIVADEYKVRADIMGGIIFKEQLTQSLPDSLANFDTKYLTGSTHSIGLAAINPGLARSAWEYVNTDVFQSLPEDDASLQEMLTDNDFNIQTLAASLRYIAGRFHNITLEQLQTITDDQWKWILNDYNNANSYNEKVMEYLPSIQKLLK